MFSSRKPPCQDALQLAVVARTSDIRVSLAFTVGHDAAHNLLLKRMCCRFAQVIGVTSGPKLLSPIGSRSVPARLGCVRRRWFQDGDAITRLKVPSTSARVDPSVLISGGAAIKPS